MLHNKYLDEINVLGTSARVRYCLYVGLTTSQILAFFCMQISAACVWLPAVGVVPQCLLDLQVCRMSRDASAELWLRLSADTMYQTF